MPKIRFLVNAELQDEHRGTDKATRYKEGQVLEMSQRSALHWLNRGLVAVVEPEAEPDKPRRGRPPKVKADA